MTGELTLRGKVLPIGGLKEKLLAAARAGMKTVIIPAANAPELTEIPPHVTDKVVVKPVRTMDEVLEIALTRSLATLRKQEQPAIEPDIGAGKPARGTRASRKPATRPGMA